MLNHPKPDSVIGAPLQRVIPADALAAERMRHEVIAETGRPLLHVPTRLVTGDGRIVQPLADLFPIWWSGETVQLRAFEMEGRHGPAARPFPVPEIGAGGAALALAILEVLSLGILIQDETTIFFANTTARAILGAGGSDRLEGRPITSIIHSDGLFSAVERMGFFFATRQKIRNVPIKLRTLDGRVLHAEADAYPLRVGAKIAALMVGRPVR